MSVKKCVAYAACVFTAVLACFSVSAFMAAAKTPKPAFVVVLDAGHGGVDGGVTGITSGVKESDLNLSSDAELLEDYHGRSLLVFASQWSINFILKRNPGLELAETAQ